MEKIFSKKLIKELTKINAIQKGHFILTSGRHSDTYVEKFRILERPKLVSKICKNILKQLEENNIEFDVVLGPTTGGIIVAFEIARQSNTTPIYVEQENGNKVLRRNAVLPCNSKVLIVDDVFTTGISTFELKSLVLQHNAVPVAISVMINRSEDIFDLNIPLFSAVTIDAKSYAVNALPTELRTIPVVKPGTRK